MKLSTIYAALLASVCSSAFAAPLPASSDHVLETREPAPEPFLLTLPIIPFPSSGKPELNVRDNASAENVERRDSTLDARDSGKIQLKEIIRRPQVAPPGSIKEIKPRENTLEAREPAPEPLLRILPPLPFPSSGKPQLNVRDNEGKNGLAAREPAPEPLLRILPRLPFPSSGKPQLNVRDDASVENVERRENLEAREPAPEPLLRILPPLPFPSSVFSSLHHTYTMSSSSSSYNSSYSQFEQERNKMVAIWVTLVIVILVAKGCIIFCVWKYYADQRKRSALAAANAGPVVFTTVPVVANPGYAVQPMQQGQIYGTPAPTYQASADQKV
ncbi:hypothetical protein HDU97_008520 [Phlyctochytrium planicorne]|nr:hypothetical protein HDU97_008520 [Phlyctochytrium planicorne]